MGGHAARAIAGDFGFGAIGIEQASLHVGIGCGKQPLHTVRAHAGMAVAGAAGKSAMSAGACMPSMIKKSLPQALALTNGIDVGVKFIRAEAEEILSSRNRRPGGRR